MHQSVRRFLKFGPWSIIGFLSAIGVSMTSLASSPSTAEPEKLYPPERDIFVPSLSHRGEHSVGVKTMSLVNPKQIDVNTQALSDRELVVELWYPTANHNEHSQYNNITRLGKPFSLHADAMRDANIKNNDAEGYPLVVISHGYTGYRSLMFYLAEHLASHGYIVAGIDHTDSTNTDVAASNPYSGFPSTLYNRTRDQQFVRQYLTAQDSPVGATIDPKSAALIGYSMGGYGLVASIGGCYEFSDDALKTMNPSASEQERIQAQQLLNNCQIATQKPWQAAIAMAPWGNQLGVFNPQRLASISTPLLTIAGDLDDVSIYGSIKQMHKLIGSEEKHLLTYLNARHNIAAHPAPAVAYEHEYDLGHYFEAAWDSRQINIINQHVTLAMMNCHLKLDLTACELLELDGLASDGDGWKGFPKRFSTGLRWE